MFREQTIQYSARCLVSNRAATTRLNNELLILEKQHSMACKCKLPETENILVKLALVKAQIHGIYNNEMAKNYTVYKNEIYEFGERLGRHLAHRTRQKQVKQK